MNTLYVSPHTGIKKYRRIGILHANQLPKQCRYHIFVNIAEDGTSRNSSRACCQISEIKKNKTNTTVTQNVDLMFFSEADERHLIHDRISSESISFVGKLISRRIK